MSFPSDYLPSHDDTVCWYDFANVGPEHPQLLLPRNPIVRHAAYIN